MTEKNYSKLGHTGNNALDAMLKARDSSKQIKDTYEPVYKPNEQDKKVRIDDSVSSDIYYPNDEHNEYEQDAYMSDSMKYTAKHKSAPKAKKKTKSNNKPKNQNGKKIAIGVGGVIVALLLASTGYTYLYPNIHLGLKAGTVEIGGMSVSEAENAINKATDSVLNNAQLTLKIYQNDYKIKISDVANGLDSKNSAQSAYDYTRTGNFFERTINSVGALIGVKEAPLSVNVNEDALGAKIDEIAKEAIYDPVDPFWTVEGDNLIVDKGKAGVSFDTDKLRTQVEDRIRKMDFSDFTVDVKTTAQKPIDAQEIYENAQTEAKNATVDKTDGKTIVPSVDGVKFDLETAKSIIGDGSQQTYTIPIERTPATITADQLSQVLFRDTLASTSTSLNPSNKSRTNNVRLASQFMNGTILNPGDVFSYNNVVGERTVARGFQQAGAYANGQVIEDVGGGVCQPSSTLYMAVLRADLEVVERHNHSLTVSYTPLGEDATVSWGGPDFQFRNNTDYPIKVLAWQEGSTMNIKILGTKTTDKTVKTSTEILETLNYDTVEKTDNSLPAGDKETSQSGATGYKTVTYKTITENGKTTTVKANNSYYKKRDKVVLVGPKQSSTTTTTSDSNKTENSTQTTTDTTNSNNTETQSNS